MAATVATDTVYDAFLSDDPNRAFLHSHTFTANPLACAVALKSLKMFEEQKILEKISFIEKKHAQFLEKLKQQHKIFMPRVLGPIMAFNIADSDGGYKNNLGEFLREWFFKNGINIRPLGNAVYIMPPYCITDKQLEYVYDKINEALHLIKTENIAA